MRKFVTIAVLMMAAMIICSCGGSGGSEGDNAPVKVSLFVETDHEDLSRIVSVADAAGAPTLTYWYKAVPQWTGTDFTTIQGAQANYVQISNYTANKDIGLFAQGAWKFYAQVKSGNTVVYESSNSPEITYINTNSTSVTLDVTRTTQNAGSADISISIDAPDTSGVSSMTLSYEGLNSPITLNKAAHATKANWSTYTYTVDDLAAGSYVFTFTSAAGAAGANPVGGAVLAFDVLAGFDKEITGTIENGVWQTTLITINIPTLNITFTPGVDSITKTGSTKTSTFTCTATATNVTGDIAYQWYVNNAPVNTATLSNGVSSLAFNASAYDEGYYYVTCRTYIDGKLSGSNTAKITVNP